MPHEIFFGIPGNKFGAGIILEKHDGEYQLVSAQKSQTGGTIWKRWGFPETKNATPQNIAIPWKITLGNHRDAIQALEYFLKHLIRDV
jgi:hypothetical protein